MSPDLLRPLTDEMRRGIGRPSPSSLQPFRLILQESLGAEGVLVGFLDLICTVYLVLHEL